MAFQGKAWETDLQLLSLGSPVVGVLYTELTLKVRKFGESALTPKALSASDWVELENGLYVLKWSEADMDVIGPMLFVLSGTSFDTHVESIYVEPAPLSLLAAPEKCLISGNILDLGGNASQPMNVNFRVAKLPKVVGGTSFVNADLIRTSPDALGNFSVSLLRGAEVVVDIDRSGIRHQFTVPDQETAQLIDLLPPIS